jgi:SNF2 family DNA or RNA helicase
VNYISLNPQLYQQTSVEATAAAAASAPALSKKEIEADLECLFSAEVADKTAPSTMELVAVPASIKTNMHPYQRQGLAWMMHQETVRHANPAPGQDSIAGWTRTTNKTGTAVYINKATKETRSEPPRLALGGLQSDDMGLGSQ